MEYNETTDSYNWIPSEAKNLQPKWHLKTLKPQHAHAQMFVEFDKLSEDTGEYKFLVHSHIYGDNACRPTIKIQFFPGSGTLGENNIYDFTEPLPTRQQAKVKQNSQSGTGIFSKCLLKLIKEGISMIQKILKNKN